MNEDVWETQKCLSSFFTRKFHGLRDNVSPNTARQMLLPSSCSDIQGMTRSTAARSPCHSRTFHSTCWPEDSIVGRSAKNSDGRRDDQTLGRICSRKTPLSQGAVTLHQVD